jgi:hypothetical protein
MGTSFDKPIDQFLMRVQDYRLDNLQVNNEQAFIKFLNGLVISSLPLFDSEFVSLRYVDLGEEKQETDESSYYFISNLDEKEISIIAHIMEFRWVEREINDIRAMNEKLKTRDFTIVNTPQIMQQKSQYLDKIREEYLYEIQQYEKNHILKGVEVET